MSDEYTRAWTHEDAIESVIAENTRLRAQVAERDARLKEIEFDLSLVILALEIHSPIDRLKHLAAIAKGE